MKKNNMKLNSLLSILALASLVLTSGCARHEERDFGKKVDMSFRADMESRKTESIKTKTILVGDNEDATRSVYWLPQDQIGISTGSEISQFIYQGGETVAEAEFSGEITPSDVYYAFYPYSSSASISSGVLSIALPSVQNYKETTFDNGSFPMVAVSSTPELHFKNLCGVLKLNLLGDIKVTAITFSAKDESGLDMKVAGAATVDLSYESVPVLTMSSSAQNTVTLDCGSGVQLNTETATPFYIVLPPVLYSSFTLIIASEDDAMTKNSTSLTINRSNIRPTDDLTFSPSPAIDLSASGTANCYIVPNAGKYTINATVIGNGPAGLLPDISQDLKQFHTTTTDIAPLSAQLLWQDTEGLISNVSLDSEGHLCFSASSGKGNALVAVYDSSDPGAEGANILWSWHLWCTTTPSDENYLNWVDRAFTLMDRNLGATAALPGDNYKATCGLHYQWGRKDPFSRNDSYLTMTLTSSENGTIANTITHPNVIYYAAGESSYDWHYASRNNYLWGNPIGYQSDYTASKTIYDPCPAGYMVSPKEPWTIFSTTGYNTSTSSEFNVSGSFSNGWTFYNSAAFSGSTSWYSAAGYRSYGNGTLSELSIAGRYWSSSPANSSADDGLAFTLTSANVSPLNNGDNDRAPGYSIRCVHVESYTPTITSPSVTSSDASSITLSSASITSQVTNLGGAQVTERGIVYSLSSDPTTETGTKVTSEITSGTNGKGSYAVDLTELTSGTTYYYKAYAINSAGTGYSEEKSFTTSTMADIVDLSASGTANCYIVSAEGNYSLNAKVIGNGPAGLLPDFSQDLKQFHATTTDISPLSARLIWQDVEGLISNVGLNSDGQLIFSASADKGNALVAVYDSSDPGADGANILWSWHLWCTDTPTDENYKNWVEREFTLMDRNLGATASLPGDNVVATYGLHYQWGRKDPFSRNDSHLTKEATSSDKGTISNTISHPTYYYYNSPSPCDWHYAERNNYLWGNPEGYNYTANYTAYKSVYDPCPPGYMIAPKDTWTGFTATGDYTNTSSQFNVSGTFSNGWAFYNSAQGSGTTSWYPAAGYRHCNGGSLNNSGSSGDYWSSSPTSSGSYYAGHLYFGSGDVDPLNDLDRAFGFSVRCSRVPQGGEFINFEISSPVLGTATATEVTLSQAKIGGEVTNLGGARVTERGVVYSTSSNPTTSTGTKVTSTITSGTNGKGTFEVTLTGLASSTTYYYKTYATNAAGTGYSEEQSFTTHSTSGGNEDVGFDEFEL